MTGQWTEAKTPMAHREILDTPEITAWLQGQQPVWRLLDVSSFARLIREAATEDGTIIIADSLPAAALAESTVLTHARLLLRHAATGRGLKLTQRGNLARTVVATMLDAFRWPGYGPTDPPMFYAVVNEPDFLPLYFLRLTMEEAGLLEPHKGYLRPSALGHLLADEARAGELQALLFRTTFWRLNLAFFDGLPIDPWPQINVNVILWCLSLAASRWEKPSVLMRQCAVPVMEVLYPSWDFPTAAFEHRILRTLSLFGLLEVSVDDAVRPGDHRRYRKAGLFDRMLSFSVTIDIGDAPVH
ncbi:MAG: hypothetical protein ABT940_02670 [Alphaproteobacteria bacterium]